MNRQIEVADSKYVVMHSDPLPLGHVTRRMRIANFTIKNCPFTLLSVITQQRIKIKA